MSFTGTGVAIGALALALVVMWRHRWQGSRFTVALMLLAGFGISQAGWAGTALAAVGGWVGGFAGEGTAQVFGVSVPAVVLIVMVAWVVIDVWDRSIHRFTPWVALALPAVLATVGGIYLGAGDDALAVIGRGLTNLAGWLGTL